MLSKLQIKSIWDIEAQNGALDDPEKLIVLADLVAENAHEGEIRYSDGSPYIGHPRAVANNFDPITETDEYILSLLHDVVETGKYSLSDIQKFGFNQNIMTGLDAITRDKKAETYCAYIQRLKTSLLAVKVKIRDIDHNRSTEVKDRPHRIFKDTIHLAARNFLTEIRDGTQTSQDAHFIAHIIDNFQPEMVEELLNRFAFEEQPPASTAENTP